MLELGAEGASIAEMGKACGVSPTTITDWAERHLEFKAAYEMARVLCQAWWENTGRVNLKAKDFNQPMWIFQMKNRFPDDWSDRRVVEVDDPVARMVREIRENGDKNRSASVSMRGSPGAQLPESDAVTH